MRILKALTAYNRIVNSGAAKDIVRFNRKHFLKRMRRAVSFKRPYFHFSKSLAASLRFPAERLLSNQRIRTDGAHMNFIFNHMRKLKHINLPDGNILVEFLARSPVEQFYFSAFWDTSFFKFCFNLFFRGIDKRRANRMISELFRSPPEVSLKNLAKVHTRRHAKRVENDINRRAVFQIRHVFFRQNLCDNALVSMASCKLISH